MNRMVCLLVAVAASPAFAAASPYFAIRVVDAETGRGVPLVELRTVHDVLHVTDSRGVVAFLEPGLMDRDVYFHVRSHGYEFPKDGFGYRGVAFRTTPGGEATLKLKRINLAERWYRVTGAGIYRDSALLDEKPPLAEPNLNAQVLGQDSVVNAVYRGKIYWFWGDTHRARYPLGNFHVPGATSELPVKGGLDPARGVDLSYFQDKDGFAKPTAQMPGQGPTWIFGLTTIAESDGAERMFAGYLKVKPPLTVYERGLVEWNDAEKKFEHAVRFEKDVPLYPDGHTFHHKDNGRDYVWFCAPYPLVRVPATAAAIRDPAQYEAYTCLQKGSRLDKPVVDRDDDGRVRYSWKAGTPAVGPEQQRELVRKGLLKPSEVLLRLRDRDTGDPVLAHGGSVAWNEFRKRWILIAVQQYGTSFLGEVWLAEAETPLGPWSDAVKIVTHEKYDFYNPKHHPMFDQEGGRVLYFEGTYTNTFAANPNPTPRYNYNQIMYRLDLGDPRTALPAAFTLEDGIPRRITADDCRDEISWHRTEFLAHDRPATGTTPVYAVQESSGVRLQLGGTSDTAPLFHALPADAASPPKTAVALWEFTHAGRGVRDYRTDANWKSAGYVRAEKPLCLVRRTP